MTRKDYKLIAGAIERARARTDEYTSGENALNGLVTDLCDRLERDNPRFNRDKFLFAALPAGE